MLNSELVKLHTTDLDKSVLDDRLHSCQQKSAIARGHKGVDCHLQIRHSGFTQFIGGLSGRIGPAGDRVWGFRYWPMVRPGKVLGWKKLQTAGELTDLLQEWLSLTMTKHGDPRCQSLAAWRPPWGFRQRISLGLGEVSRFPAEHFCEHAHCQTENDLSSSMTR
jgi:hypothetical protein